MTPLLNEKQRRLFLASEAKSYGRGGISKVSQISGVSRTTILAGIKELKTAPVDTTRIREIGGGRKLTEDNIPQVQEKIREIVEDSTYGDPEKLLSWTTESLRTIQVKLLELHNIKISFKTVGSILGDLGYSKQANQKMPQVGKAHPDRNAQFEFINNKAKEFFEASEPVISVDTKKKENLGNLKNNGREYRRKKDPRKSLDHDFFIEELGKIAPYGVYALNDNIGFANVGISHDTAEFAVESISRWWEVVGKFSFPKAQKLFVNYDCGGSTGNRVRLWKYQLAQLSERIGLEIHVSHFPPGTSKWNKIEHKLFCFISKKWEGKPLIDIKTAVKLIGSTKTTKGLRVICQADDTYYELAKKVTDEQFNSIDLVQLSPFDAWNYIVKGFK
jgi:transposase